MIATEGQPGLWFNTMADNNIADGKMAMYVRTVCVLCVHLHAWVCRGEQGSMSMKSSSTVKL